MERGSTEYCNYLYDMAFTAAKSGQSLNGFLVSELDCIDACTIEELQYIITGFCIGEIEREENENKLRLVTNKH